MLASPFLASTNKTDVSGTIPVAKLFIEYNSAKRNDNPPVPVTFFKVSIPLRLDISGQSTDNVITLPASSGNNYQR